APMNFRNDLDAVESALSTVDWVEGQLLYGAYSTIDPSNRNSQSAARNRRTYLLARNKLLGTVAATGECLNQLASKVITLQHVVFYIRKKSGLN
ncbi:hypothetical protein V3C99_019218, partial [Haemonchus contortus]